MPEGPEFGAPGKLSGGQFSAENGRQPRTDRKAITAFLEGNSFEDVIRTAVSLGGDCDTLTCIAGSIAEACYGVPEALRQECRNRLIPDMLRVLDEFDKCRKAPSHDAP